MRVEVNTMYGYYCPTVEAEAVLARLEYADLMSAEALLLSDVGVRPVNGLIALLNSPSEYIAIPVHKDHLPKELYSDVVYLRPFADVAQAIQAPFGVDTVYAVKRREPKPRTGSYRLPAPSNR